MLDAGLVAAQTPSVGFSALEIDNGVVYRNVLENSSCAYSLNCADKVMP